jgi:hypothetical protein
MGSQTSLENPICPTCTKPVGEQPWFCPTCKTPYHLECFEAEGCLVAGCREKSQHPVQGEGPDPYSPLWSYVMWGWVIVGSICILYSPLFGHYGTSFFPMPLIGLPVTMGIVFWHDLVLRPFRCDWIGTLGWAIVFSFVSLLLISEWLGLWVVWVLWELRELILPGFCLLTAIFFVGLFKDRSKRRSGLGLVVALLPVFIAIIPPLEHHHCRERPNIRACYANQKTISGAVEMYNLDKGTKVTTLDAHFFEVLKSGGYLQSIPQDPGQGSGSSSNYQMTAGGPNGIRCKVHGQIQ